MERKNGEYHEEVLLLINIVLFCSTGLSTKLLIKKMEQAAAELQLEISVKSYPEVQIGNYIVGADVVLAGPQVKYALPHIQEECKLANIPLEVISAKDYGLMDGMKILNQALRLVKKD